jgi:hypothetical protein
MMNELNNSRPSTKRVAPISHKYIMILLPRITNYLNKYKTHNINMIIYIS